MEIKTFKMDVDVKKRKTIIDNEVFGTVMVKNYWNAHGEIIDWEDDEGKTSHIYKNAKVFLEEVTRVCHFKYSGDSEYTAVELTINGKRYEGDITSCKGSGDQLVLRACIGAG